MTKWHLKRFGTKNVLKKKKENKVLKIRYYV